MEQTKRDREVERLAAIHETMRRMGIQKRLIEFLKAEGDITNGRAAKVEVKDVVHYRKVAYGGVNQGWDLDYEYTRTDGHRIRESLGLDPEQGFGDPDGKPLTMNQFQTVKTLARFEGDDLTTVFSVFGMDRGLRSHYGKKGIDPDKANIRIEALASLPPELSKTQKALVAVGIMYTNTEGQRTPAAFGIEPGGGFDEELPLHPRLFQILLDLATEVKMK